MPTSCERLEATIGIAPVLIKRERGNNGFRFSAQSDFPRLKQMYRRLYEMVADGVSFLTSPCADQAHRVAGQVNAETFWTNSDTTINVASPFGGYGMSEYGRSSAVEALCDYTRTKSVRVERAKNRLKNGPKKRQLHSVIFEVFYKVTGLLALDQRGKTRRHKGEEQW
jgi:hypothetical protein